MTPATLYPLAERAVLQFTGSERVRWLDGMLSNDVANLPVWRALPALVLTHQGRIVSDGFVLALPDALYFDLEAAALEATRAHLERFIIADDVQVYDLRARTARLSLDGPGAAAALEACGFGTAPGAGAIAQTECAGASLLVAGYGFTGEPALQLFAPPAAVATMTARLLEVEGVEAGDAARFECRRIEAGTPRFGSELDQSVLPAEARLSAAVSDTKGCYTGQEVVARMRSRGRVGHLLVGLRFEGAPPEASVQLMFDDKVVGEVSSAVHSPEFGAIGLGFVKAAHAEPGRALALRTTLETGQAGAPARAQVVALPHRPQ